MARKTPVILPPPDNSLESIVSSSRKSEKSAASVTDIDYHQSLRYRNIYIERKDPPIELMRRAKRIISHLRASPEIDDTTAQDLGITIRRLRNEPEDVIIKQLAPGIIPAMNRIPDCRLEMNSDQLWSNSVRPDQPTPITKTKSDLAFGFSERAFSEVQLGTIDLLIDDQFERSYVIPDQKLRFPFLSIEFSHKQKMELIMLQ